MSRIAQIKQSGADARASGASIFDNPYYKLENLPTSSKLTIDQWKRYMEAWDAGWHGLTAPE